ncbi:hypothetical protein GCM10022198_10580 [Klugiella xanthotipulae]|uniref:DUF3592 domain-containing protein n=1 Tax=Klugiella xanthotipulae TaxID=244735 RepID=UPI0014776118|nr:DUF3592 domain-containing protein [Klugiella xanthotipulae]
MRKYLNFSLLGIVLIFFGLIMSVPAITENIQHQAMAQRSETVTGTVTSSHTKTTHARRGSNNNSYCPVYSYTPTGGTTLQLIDYHDCNSNMSSVHSGETAPISYDPNDPDVAFVDTQHTASALTVNSVVGVVAVILGIVALTISVVSRRRARRNAALADPVYPPVEYGQPQ